MTQDERRNRFAEWHGSPKCRSCRTIGGSMTPCIQPGCSQYVTEDHKQRVLQSMIDHCDYLDGLRPLRQEVITRHLIPRKMTYCELKQTVLIPVAFVATVAAFFAVVL